MHRRALLGRFVGVGIAGLAGCTGAGGSETRSPEPTGRPTESPEPEPDQPTVGERSFEVLAVECGSASDGATVSTESQGDRRGLLTVEGTIVGGDSCHTARLAAVGFDGSTLTLAVESYVPASRVGDACLECLVDIDYRAAMSYEGAGSFDVVVEHDGTVVTRATDSSLRTWDRLT